MPIERNWLSDHHSFGTGYKKGYKDGYVKAIEEFTEALKKRCKMKFKHLGFTELYRWEIDAVAEELKKNSNELKGE